VENEERGNRQFTRTYLCVPKLNRASYFVVFQIFNSILTGFQMTYFYGKFDRRRKIASCQLVKINTVVLFRSTN
jgi:hypothetical protein